MKKKLTKERFTAFIIDMFILISIISLISVLFYFNQAKLEDLSKQFIELNSSFVNKELVEQKVFIDKSIHLLREHNILQIPNYLVNIIITVLYFVIMPFIMKQTLGMRLMKIELYNPKGELKLYQVFIRSLFLNALWIGLLNIVLCLILPGKLWFVITSIALLIHIFLLIKTSIMVLYRKDGRGLQDIFSQTKIREVIE